MEGEGSVQLASSLYIDSFFCNIKNQFKNQLMWTSSYNEVNRIYPSTSVRIPCFNAQTDGILIITTV
jgi:hypothetical protein